MRVKVRREYLLEELYHRLKTLQKDLKSKFGVAQLKDGATTLCAFLSCDMCIHFDEAYPCKTQEVLNLSSLIVMLEDSKEEYFEIEVEGEKLEF